MDKNKHIIKYRNKYDKKILKLSNASDKCDLVSRILMIVGGSAVVVGASMGIVSLEKTRKNYKDFKQTEYYIEQRDDAVIDAWKKFENNECSYDELNKLLEHLQSDKFAVELMKTDEDQTFIEKNDKFDKQTKTSVIIMASGMATFGVMAGAVAAAKILERKALELQKAKERKEDEEEGAWDYERWQRTKE